MSQTRTHLYLNLLTVLFYLLISLFFVRGILFSKGIVSGGDWGYPLTHVQIDRYFKSGFYTWTDRELLGSENYFLTALPAHVTIKLSSLAGITGDTFTKAILIFSFALLGTSMFFLCRFFNISKKVSLLGGLFYMSLPAFFNYGAMGWVFVLVSMGILPFALIMFIRSVRERSVTLAIITGFLYTLGLVQNQTVVWYPIVFLCFAPFLITTKKDFFAYLRSLGTVVLVFFLLNPHWYLPLFLGGGSGILNTRLGASSISLGTWARLDFVNIIRVWGSLFNEPYEAVTAFSKNLVLLSYVLPFTAYLALVVKAAKKTLLYSLLLLTFVPLVLFLLGPNVIVQLPFSDLIRDIARFLVLSSFAYVILSALTLDKLFKDGRSYLRFLGTILVFLLFVASASFWTGELTGESRQPHDVRLRTYEYSPEYEKVESILAKDPGDFKVLYLPIVGELSLTDDRRFFGSFQGIRDTVASYSPKPGAIGLSDRLKGPSKNFLLDLEKKTNNLQFANLSDVLALMNVTHIVVRKNMTNPHSHPGREMATEMKKHGSYALIEDAPKVALFKNSISLPHFYLPKKSMISDTQGGLVEAIDNADNYALDSVIYLTAVNKPENITEIEKNVIPFEGEVPDGIVYRKIDPTLYRVKIIGATRPFTIVFSESYHDAWKLIPAGISSPVSGNMRNGNELNTVQNDSLPRGNILDIMFKRPMFENTHYVANAYANSWVIDPGLYCQQAGAGSCRTDEDGKKEIELLVHFSPQNYFYLGFAVSVIGYVTLIGFLVYRYKIHG